MQNEKAEPATSRAINLCQYWSTYKGQFDTSKVYFSANTALVNVYVMPTTGENGRHKAETLQKSADFVEREDTECQVFVI